LDPLDPSVQSNLSDPLGLLYPVILEDLSDPLDLSFLFHPSFLSFQLRQLNPLYQFAQFGQLHLLALAHQ